jgi:hypothetical protein
LNFLSSHTGSIFVNGNQWALDVGLLEHYNLLSFLFVEKLTFYKPPILLVIKANSPK